MGKLSDEEQSLLEKLQAKMEAPEETISKAVNFTVDLGDKAQVALAKTLGLITGGDPDPDEPDDKPDDAPKRRGYFKDDK
jgi:hypothetical protein